MASSPKKIARDLQGAVTGEVHADPLRRALYSTDASIYQVVPACVIVPRSKHDIVAAVKYAAENRIPIAPRGGGSGLAGESLCAGIVVDLSKYLDRIVAIDAHADTVTCQAGVIFERLNSALAPLGKVFGPDPSSGNRATIGGMIANNATGAHSIKYGYTDAYIDELEVLLADGRIARFKAEQVASVNSDLLDGAASRTSAAPADAASPAPENELTAAVSHIVQRNRKMIARCMPRSARNRSGYALDKVVQNDRIHLGRLIAGSEGTLGIVTEAKLRTLDAPKITGLLQITFDSLDAMARAVPAIVARRPSTCEMMDGLLIDLARSAHPQYHDVLPAGVGACLLVEHHAGSPAELREKFRATASAVPAAGCSGCEIIESAGQQQRIWASRKAAVPLLFRRPGRRRPVPFIEDIAVPVDRLAEFIAGLQAILRRYRLRAAFYAHAGHGQLHTRPFLDLSDPGQVAKMQHVADEAFALAWRLGGTISGEHGDGLVRAQFVKHQYGELYPVMRQIKQLFDPHNILNPGKIITDDGQVMAKNLRWSRRARPDRLNTCLIFGEGELIEEAERCNGDALCRSLESRLTMCPIFRATREESASPRGFASLTRHRLTGLFEPQGPLAADFTRIIGLCLQCKMCHVECPSAVNVPKLVLEARARDAASYGLGRTEWLLARSETIAKLGSTAATVANTLTSAPVCRWLLEKLGGIDRRRQLPQFDGGSFDGQTTGSRKKTTKPVARVVYFADSFATYYDHQLARDAVAVLEHNDVEVAVFPNGTCAMPAIVYADARRAQRTVRSNTARLARLVRQGYEVVCSEPTAALCLKQEYAYWDSSFAATLVANHSHDLCAFLRMLHSQQRLRTDFRPVEMTLGYHAPCHLKALQIGYPGLELLRLVPGLTIVHIDEGCCGIGGTFGFQAKNYELSMQIGAPLMDAVRSEPIDSGATECSTCKVQIEQGSGKRTLHPITVLARAYGLRDRQSGLRA